MFDSSDFVSLGERLIQQSPKEPEFRTAIGRAYYGAFLAARTHEQMRCGRRFSNHAGSHAEVIHSLEGFDTFVSEDLETLRKLRNRADYDLDYKNAHNDSQAALESARYILRKLR